MPEPYLSIKVRVRTVARKIAGQRVVYEIATAQCPDCGYAISVERRARNRSALSAQARGLVYAHMRSKHKVAA